MGGTKPPPWLTICASCWARAEGALGGGTLGVTTAAPVRDEEEPGAIGISGPEGWSLPPAPAARITSSLVTRPRSPVPCTPARSTFCSSAALRTVGVASGARADTDAGAMETGGPGAAESARLSSSCAMTAFTATTSPSAASSFEMRPAAGAGRSLSALSVAIDTSGWSFLTMSPTRTSHFEMVPSETLSPSCGRVTSMIMEPSFSRMVWAAL